LVHTFLAFFLSPAAGVALAVAAGAGFEAAGALALESCDCARHGTLASKVSNASIEPGRAFMIHS
jgi:hypothetical protein